MAKNLVGKIQDTELSVVEGDITRIPADAIMTAINSGGMWFGGIDGAIQRVAGNHYHSQAQKAMPLTDLQTVVAKGNRKNHKGQFDNVVFVVDELESPLERVVYNGLEAVNNAGFRSVLVPTIRMGVMLGAVEKSAQEAVDRISDGTQEFLDKYGKGASLQDLKFVVYNDSSIANNLRTSLGSRFGSKSSRKVITPNTDLKIGDLPYPQYMSEAPDTTSDENIRWIGVKAYGLSGKVEDFLWWRNVKSGSLNDEKSRHDAAAFIARLKMGMQVDSVFGHALDLGNCNQSTGKVAVAKERGVYGVYVEAQKRPMFNFMTMMNGLETEEVFRRKDSREFEKIYLQARAVLPYSK